MAKYRVAKPKNPKVSKFKPVEVMDLIEEDSPPEEEHGHGRKRGRSPGIERHSKRQRLRKKETLRGSSPSHFNMDFDEEEKVCPDYLRLMPDHNCVNGILEATA